MKRVLFDTDVLLDFLFDRKPFSDNTLKLLLACQDKKLIGFLTPVIFSNMYYILRQQASLTYVKEKLGVLLSVLRVLPMNEQTVQLALNSSFKDMEDAMQYFSALKTPISTQYLRETQKIIRNQPFLFSFLRNGWRFWRKMSMNQRYSGNKDNIPDSLG